MRRRILQEDRDVRGVAGHRAKGPRTQCPGSIGQAGAYLIELLEDADLGHRRGSRDRRPARDEAGRTQRRGIGDGSRCGGGNLPRDGSPGGFRVQLAPRDHEIENHLARAPVTFRRLFPEGACDDLLQTFGHEVGLGPGVGLLGHHLGHHLRHARARERVHAGEHLVEHDAQREEVGPLVQGVAESLFRRQVVEGADDHPFARMKVRPRRVAGALGEDLAEPEVEYFHVTVGCEHEVRRRDVPMQDAALMRDLQALERLNRDVEALRDREAPPVHDLVQALAFEVFEDEIEGSRRDPHVARVRRREVVDRDHVRMVQSRDGTRFVHETPAHLRVTLEGGREDLDGDLAAQRGIRREVDLSHPTAAEQAENLVPADALGKWFRGHRAASIGIRRRIRRAGGPAGRVP